MNFARFKDRLTILTIQIFGIKQHYCPFCKNIGETIDHVRCFSTKIFEQRTHSEALMWYRLIDDTNGKDIYKFKSPIVEDYSSMQEMFSLDNLHHLFSGIELRYLKYHVDPKYHENPWYLKPNTVKEIDKQIAQIKLPSSYHQIPSLKRLQTFSLQKL